jgi:hypothetical protein
MASFAARVYQRCRHDEGDRCGSSEEGLNFLIPARVSPALHLLVACSILLFGSQAGRRGADPVVTDQVPSLRQAPPRSSDGERPLSPAWTGGRRDRDSCSRSSICVVTPDRSIARRTGRLHIGDSGVFAGGAVDPATLTSLVRLSIMRRCRTTSGCVSHSSLPPDSSILPLRQ